MQLKIAFAVLMLIAVLGVPQSYAAKTSGAANAGLRIELNAMRSVKGACRVAFVIESELQSAITADRIRALTDGRQIKLT